jgi:DNA-binding transcriptional LysR family regulator
MQQIERFFERSLKLSHLRLLTLFAACGQIRLVAERLNVTQPAVSKQLAELEAGLGAPVMVRIGNRLQFTALGEALLKRAREVFLQLEQARHEADALCGGISGTLAVGAVATVLPVIAPELILQLKHRAPNLNVSFFEATSDRLFPMLANGELDLVFSRTEPTARNVAVTGEQILEDPIGIVCGRNHPLASRRGIVPADLVGLPWILPPQKSPAFLVLGKWLEANELSLPPGCVESIGPSVNETLLESYPFLGLMPCSMVRTRSNREAIKILQLADASFLSKVWLFHNPLRLNPIVDAALESVTPMRERLTDQLGATP